jgi:hypothetical protein
MVKACGTFTFNLFESHVNMMNWSAKSPVIDLDEGRHDNRRGVARVIIHGSIIDGLFFRQPCHIVAEMEYFGDNDFRGKGRSEGNGLFEFPVSFCK